MCNLKDKKKIADLEKRLEMITNVNKHLVEKVKELREENNRLRKENKNMKEICKELFKLIDELATEENKELITSRVNEIIEKNNLSTESWKELGVIIDSKRK